MNKRSGLVLVVAAVTVLVLAFAAYLLFFNDPGSVEGRPSFVYFRLPT